MLAIESKTTKSPFLLAYTVLVIHPFIGDTRDVMAACEVLAALYNVQPL